MIESTNSNYISIEDFKLFIDSKAKIEFEHIETGKKNALDFQLAMSLAITITENQDKNYQYYIVSNDKDFEIVIKYLKNKTGKSVNLVNRFQIQKEVMDLLPEDLDISYDSDNLLEGINNSNI